MHYRKGSNVKGHYRNGTWIASHTRSETKVSDSMRKKRFISDGRRYMFPEPKKICTLTECECEKLSYFEIKMMIKKGLYSDILLNVAYNKENELFSNMSYDELLSIKKKGSYHCINYEMLLDFLDDLK